MGIEGIERELFFSQEEYDSRLARLRADMAARGVDTLMLSGPENIFYISGYQTFGFHNYQLVVIPSEGKPFLILRYMESMLAYRYAWTDDVVTWDDTVNPVSVTIQELEKRGLTKGVIGVEEKSYFFLVSHWKQLKDALPRVVDGSGIIELGRAVKSPQELAYMREAGRLTTLGANAAIAEIAAGRSDNDVVAAAYDAMIRAGSEYVMREPIITTGQRSGIPHTTAMREKLKDGDAVLIELSGVFHRYYAPVMRGAVVGRASPTIEKMAAVCLEGLHAGIEKVKPGNTSAEVDLAVREVINRYGMWDNYRKRAGYSVGIGFSSWVEGAIASLKEDDPTVLKPGMCFHLPIALRVYDEAGLGFSETVVVTETGCETLSNVPRELARR